MDYAAIAAQIIEQVGGKDNIRSVQHCATRLRFQLKNADLRNEDAISDIEGVKGVFMTNSQFQIILGSGLVNLVCDEVQKQIGMLSDTAAPEEEEKKGSAVQRFIKMFSDIFVPIIPAIVAGGLLMGINNVLTAAMFEGGKSIIDMFPQFRDLATCINIFANAPFTFLPVLIGFSATKRFGGNPYLGAAMGMIMVHPDLLNAYSLGTGVEVPTWNLFGLTIDAVGYQGTVLPVLAVSWILANIEKRLHKVTPTWLDNLTTPLLSIMISAFITFLFVGPIMRGAGNLLADGITDPHNLGAILRSAECLGAHGVIIPQRRSVSVNDTAVKSSSGAAAYVKVAKVVNLNDAIRQLKSLGVWVYACDFGGEPPFRADLADSTALIVGSEGEGVKRLTRELADGVITIPECGRINSLNASVAAGIMLYEAARQRAK